MATANRSAKTSNGRITPVDSRGGKTCAIRATPKRATPVKPVLDMPRNIAAKDPSTHWPALSGGSMSFGSQFLVDTQTPERVDLSIASRISWFLAPKAKSGKQPRPPPAKSNPKKAEYCGTCEPQ